LALSDRTLAKPYIEYTTQFTGIFVENENRSCVIFDGLNDRCYNKMTKEAVSSRLESIQQMLTVDWNLTVDLNVVSS